MEPELIPKISSILSQKSLTPSDFAFFKSLPAPVFEKAIIDLPPESTAKILDYMQNSISNTQIPIKIREKHPKKPSAKPTESVPPFLENYNRGMFKHLWLEDVKKIHRAILPTGENSKLEDFPEKLSLNHQTTTEKPLSFVNIIEKMIHVFGEPRKNNHVLALKSEEIIKKFLKILLDPQNLCKLLVIKQQKKTRKMVLKRLFSNYLKSLFPKEFKRFSEVKEASKLVFASDFIEESEENDQELLDFAENLSDEPEKDFKIDPNKEEFDFLNARIDVMSQEEFLEFSYHRSLNFLSLGREAFLDFLEFDNLRANVFKELKPAQLGQEVEFLNYILCRVLKEAVESSIRSINSGTLKPLQYSIPLTLFEEKADSEVIGLKLKLKKLLAQKTSIEEKAFRLFLKEYWLFDYHKVLEGFSTKIRLVKSNSRECTLHEGRKQDDNDEEDPTAIWKNMKGLYQKFWFQRILAESQVKRFIKTGISGNFVNDFAKILYEAQVENWEADASLVFKEWFMGKILGNNQNKKVSLKLESIFD